MKKKLLKLKQKNGYSLVEVLVVVLIMSFLMITIMGLFSYSVKIVSENRLRAAALALTDQKLELIKNLSYNDVGTLGGIPAGTLLQSEVVTFNGGTYTITTQVIYIDDPADGILGVDPSELSGTDYKKVKVKASWTGPFGNKSASQITNVSPRRNQDEPDKGSISILVFNANGDPVPQADIRIMATVGTTTIDITAQTNNQGRLVLPGAPAAQNAYSISTTKAGYSTDKTCAILAGGASCEPAEGNPSPTKPHASVVAGGLTEISFAIDVLSTLRVKTLRQSLPTQWIINTDATAFDQDNPAITVCENGNYIFTWRDFRQNNNPRIYAQMYDVNLTPLWNQDLAITTSNNQNNPDVINDKNCNTYVTWNDDRNGNQDAYYEKFNTVPASEWSGSKKLSTGAEAADQTFPQIVFGTTPPFAYLSWLDARDGATDIYSQKINPNTGALQWSPEVKINVYNGVAPVQNKPRIAIDSSENLIFVWQDSRNGNNDIFMQKMDKNGNVLWAQDIKINTDATTAEQTKPAFAIGSTTPSFYYTVWQDERNGNSDIYSQKYDSSGVKVWGNDMKINSDSGSAMQENPVITEDRNGNFYIVWEDSRNGNSDIYLQKIDPDGNKLISFDVRINSSITGEQENPDIYINKDGYPVITWQDNSNGDYDVRAAVFGIDPETITPVGNVPITITGTKHIGENPVIFKYVQNFITDSGGNVTINNIEWDSYSIIAGGYTILRTEPNLPVFVNPAQTVDLVLNLQ